MEMDKLFHNVNDLPASARSVVENLIGHPLRDDQQLFMIAIDPLAEPPKAQRRAAWNELKGLFDVMHENVKQSGRSQEEIDQLVDEACESVRYGG
jgi:hypothetical protein